LEIWDASSFSNRFGSWPVWQFVKIALANTVDKVGSANEEDDASGHCCFELYYHWWQPIEFGEIHSCYTNRKDNSLEKRQSIIALRCKLIRVFFALATKDENYAPIRLLVIYIIP
jgi:hypothetical protein